MTPVGVYGKEHGYFSYRIRVLVSPFEVAHEETLPVFSANVTGPVATPPFETDFTGWYTTTNYVYNGMMLSLEKDGQSAGAKSITDGLAHTVMLAERLQVCGVPGREVPTLWGMGAFSATTAAFALASPIEPHPKTTTPGYDLQQYVPPTSIRADTKIPAAFQLTPALAQCDPTILQTANPAGMMIAAFDGSVRVIPQKINPRLFWASVTPAGAEEIASE